MRAPLAAVATASLVLSACSGSRGGSTAPNVIVTPDALAIDLWSSTVSRCRELALTLPHVGATHDPNLMFTAYYAYVENHPRCIEALGASTLTDEEREMTAATLDVVLAQAHHMAADAAYLEGDIGRVCRSLDDVEAAALGAGVRLDACDPTDPTGAIARMRPAIEHELWFASAARHSLCADAVAP